MNDKSKSKSSGESGGGAYPTDREPKKQDGTMGHGGQSDMGYHGTGRLGGEKTGGNANAPATEKERDDGRGE